MSRGGLSMHKAREILRLRFDVGLSARKTAKSCKVSHSTVLEYESRVREAKLSWPLPEGMDDEELERIVHAQPGDLRHDRPMPDTEYLVKEMHRPHVTLYLLWMDYKEVHPDGYGYTQFCHHYAEAKKKLAPTLRQEHKAGEKVFTDY